MKSIAFVVLLAIVLCGCSNPKDTVIPSQLDKMESIKPAIEKLTPEEKQLFTSYLVRHTVGAAMGGLFGIKADPIPDGMTIGKAIDEQREYVNKENAKEAAEKELKARVEAEQKAKQEEFAKLISVAVTAKKNRDGDYGQRFVSFDVAYENKGDKDIAGIKGILRIADMFGDKVLSINWGFDSGVGAHKTFVEKGSGLKVNQFMDEHMKLWNTEYEKLKFSFIVSKIVFKDGSSMEMPE